MAKEGVHVAITGRREEQLKLTVKELQDLGVTATYAVFDISDLTSVQQGIEQLNHSFGKFDIVINNAGIASFGSLLDMDADMWTSIIQTNVLGSYYVTKAILPQLIEKMKVILSLFLLLQD